ncbi:MAG: bis(5'-nucleosyl)-tetraphosphatase (symmetrical) YqeK [Vulcanimicrobiaceae bacterium]
MTGSRFARLTHEVRAQIGGAHRYAHSVRVARFAGRLARRHGEDATRARLAGLLHDIARLYDVPRLLAECAARGLTLDAFETRNPIVMHARLGAALARERFGIDDAGVLDAIARHTVAAPVMSGLDAVLFLADALEPGRTFADRAAYAELAFVDLEGAMTAVLSSTVDYLKRRELEVAPQTLAALATYQSRQRRPLSA